MARALSGWGEVDGKWPGYALLNLSWDLKDEYRALDERCGPRSHVLSPVLLAPDIPMSSPHKKIFSPLLCYQENLSCTSPCNNLSVPILLSIVEMPKASCGCHHFLGVLQWEFSSCFKIPSWSLQHIYQTPEHSSYNTDISAHIFFPCSIHIHS